MTMTEHLMTISQNGQVSIPASARARWHTRRVLVVDLGDRIVVRPAPEGDPVAPLRGKYAGLGPDTTSARRRARQVAAARPRG